MRIPFQAPLVAFAVFVACALVAGAVLLAVRGESQREPLTLHVFASSRPAGEVLLVWSGGAAGAHRWEYRMRGPIWQGRQLRENASGEWETIRNPAGNLAEHWEEWREVPQKRTRVTSYRVGGLHPRFGYEFQVRQRASGDSDPSPVPYGGQPQWGPDGVVYAYPGSRLEPGGTFRLHQTPYVFTVPTRGQWRLVQIIADVSWVGNALIDEKSQRAVHIHPSTGMDDGCYVAGIKDAVECSDIGVTGLLSSIRFAPEELHQLLTVVTTGRAGEIVLKWASGPRDATHWQFRWRESEEWTTPNEWSEWVDLSRTTSRTRSHRLTEWPGGFYDLEIRAWAASGPADTYASVSSAYVSHASPPAIPYAIGGQELEGGQTFRLREHLAFDVPEGLRLMPSGPLGVWGDDGQAAATLEPLRFETYLWDLDTGSWLRIDTTNEVYLGRHITREGRRSGVDSLFDEIVASTRQLPRE